MPLYRFYFLDDDGEVHDVRAVEARKDSIAIEQADEFLAAKSDHIAIEIWRAQDFVRGVRRDSTRYDRSPIHIGPRTPMISDLDLWRAANLMIERHGTEAALVTAQRADEILAAGDVEGPLVWKRILAAINELQRTKIAATECRH